VPRKPKNDVIAASYFRWLIVARHGTLYADGRGNTPNLGRHLLGTKDRTEAVQRLAQLDCVKAVEFGLADASILQDRPEPAIGLQRGWQLYDEHLARPEVAGGASAKTRQRYAAILDKFIPFAEGRGVHAWTGVTARLVSSYLAYLQKEGYAERTLYAEGTVIKQLIRWLVDEQQVPRECVLKLPLRKVRGSDRYCYRPAEVEAMLSYCAQHDELRWLGDVLLALSRTGLRISELVALRWTDVDLDHNVIRIMNDRGVRAQRDDRRQTKNRTDRSFPIKAELHRLFERLPRGKDAYVFHGPRGGRLKPDTARTIFITSVIESLKAEFPTPPGEIGFEHGRLHSFRHFFCSRCANEGVPERMVMEWLGHQDSEMVRYYYHLLDADSQRQMQRISFTGPAGGDVAAGAASDKPEDPESGQPTC